jgi:hypothetical protein
VTFTKKIVLGAAALALPIASIAMVGVGTASAARTGTTGTGTLTCNGIKGSITFKPALKNGGTAAENTTIKITVSKCTGGTPNPKKGTVKQDISTSTSTNNCLSLQTSSAQSLTVKWAGGILPSTSAYSGYTTGTAGNGDEEFILPDSGGTGSTSGSYTNSTSSATAVLNESSSTIATKCGTAAGVKSLKITSGTTTL